ncbi:MAG: siphovirus Gp157 family protein [Oxalobacter sp.]|nr:siphovirus Gp157 family protein [Oxalobacter sp.]
MAEKKSLILLAQEYRQIADLVADRIDAAEDETEIQCLKDTLEGEAWPLETKAAGIALYISRLGMLSNAISSQAKVLAERKRAIDSRIRRIKEYLLEGMVVANITKIECADITISRRKNPASVEVFEEGLVPQAYMRTPLPPPPEPDRKAILAALKAGGEVQGCRLVQKERVDIK